MIKKFKEAIHERETLIELIINAKKDDPETGSFTEHLVDYLTANGVTVQEGKPLEAFLHPVVAHKGLKAKYLVFGAASGKEIKNCFVLRPDKDPAAVEALRAYARTTDNETLAEDIYNWVGKGKPVQEWIPVTEKSPKPLEKVLTYRQSVGDNFSKIAIDYMFIADGKAYWSGDLETWKTVATHWMPLPQPPKGE